MLADLPEMNDSFSVLNHHRFQPIDPFLRECLIQPQIRQFFLDAVCTQAFVEVLEVDEIEVLVLVKA